MPELSPYYPGGSGLADSAYHLAGLLSGTRLGESTRAATMRIRARELLIALADDWLAEPQPVDSKRRFQYNAALWKLRDLADDLTNRIEPAPSAVRTVLESFQDSLHIDAFITLRPSGLATFWGRDQMKGLRDRLNDLNIADLSLLIGLPERLLTIRYPQGEQDATLMACLAVPYLLGPGMQAVAAISVLGPAYFFALAAEMQNYKGFSDAFDPPKLRFVGELLEISGWLDHALVGPLIQSWLSHFELGPDYRETHLVQERLRTQMREAKEQFRGLEPLYSISDFDRTVPHMIHRVLTGQPLVDSNRDSDPEDSASDIASVLNAGWITAQRHLSDLYERSSCNSWIDRYNVRCNLNRALAAGIVDICASTAARS